mgnify:CR=1 FL=1
MFKYFASIDEAEKTYGVDLSSYDFGKHFGFIIFEVVDIYTIKCFKGVYELRACDLRYYFSLFTNGNYFVLKNPNLNVCDKRMREFNRIANFNHLLGCEFECDYIRCVFYDKAADGLFQGKYNLKDFEFLSKRGYKLNYLEYMEKYYPEYYGLAELQYEYYSR